MKGLLYSFTLAGDWVYKQQQQQQKTTLSELVLLRTWWEGNGTSSGRKQRGNWLVSLHTSVCVRVLVFFFSQRRNGTKPNEPPPLHFGISGTLARCPSSSRTTCVCSVTIDSACRCCCGVKIYRLVLERKCSVAL